MKTLLTTLATTTLISSLSMAATTSVQKLECSGDISHSQIGNIKTIQVTAEALLGDWLKNVTVNVQTDEYDGSHFVTGRRAQMDSDEKYKPRKYLNHLRYNLRELTNVQDFSEFLPGDICEIQLMIPQDASKLQSFSAPVVINCDQSGGSVALDCKLN
jgi:hypothetical protein